MEAPVDSDAWDVLLHQRQEERAASIADSFARAEMEQALWQANEESQAWRARAEEAERRIDSLLPLANASCNTCEEMLSRLAQAKSLAGLADLSRMAFEVRTTMMEIEERARNGGARGSTQARRPPTGGGVSPSRAAPRAPPAAGRRAAQPTPSSRSSPSRGGTSSRKDVARERAGESDGRRGGGTSSARGGSDAAAHQQQHPPPHAAPPGLPAPSWAANEALASLCASMSPVAPSGGGWRGHDPYQAIWWQQTQSLPALQAQQAAWWQSQLPRPLYN
jgi:hypothetical protein